MNKILISLSLLFMSQQSWAHGEDIFTQKCAACHQVSGEGIPGAFPALKDNQFVTEQTTEVIETVMYGRAGMPSFKNDLDDQAMLDVINYIKNAWGNTGKNIELSQVTTSRNNKDGHQALARQN